VQKNRELKELAVIPFSVTSKKLAVILSNLQEFVSNPENPKVFITLLTEKGFL
jgi:hypothetical protein